MRKLLLVAIMALAGCATNHGAVQISPDTYMISRTDKGGIFGNASAMKSEVLAEAGEFAARLGKVSIPVSLNERPMIVGHSLASIEYQFRVVDKDDPEARRVSLIRGPDLVIEKTEKITNDTNVKTTGQKADLYAELMKLDDLKKRGLLTPDEFDAQKRKLLNSAP
jgi:hypothetical protein